MKNDETRILYIDKNPKFIYHSTILIHAEKPIKLRPKDRIFYENIKNSFLLLTLILTMCLLCACNDGQKPPSELASDVMIFVDAKNGSNANDGSF